MAADSIAKLAVIITGDAAPLTAEMGRASKSVDSWSAGMQRMQRSGMGMENIDPLSQLTRGATAFGPAADSASRATLKFSTALSAMKGNLAANFAMGGPAALGIAAMTLGVKALADAHEDLLQKLEVEKLQTATGQWERLREQMGILGTPFGEAKTDFFAGLADGLRELNEVLFPDVVHWAEETKARLEALEAATKKKAEADKLAKKHAKEHSEAMKAIADAAAKEREELAQFIQGEAHRADSIKDSVRTPGEILRRDLHELRSMFMSGFLNEDIATRAAMASRKRFDEATKKPPEEPRSGVGAFDRNTMAGFSAVQGGLREIERLEKVQKDQLKEEQNQTAVQKEIRDILHGQTPIVLIGETP